MYHLTRLVVNRCCLIDLFGWKGRTWRTCGAVFLFFLLINIGMDFLEMLLGNFTFRHSLFCGRNEADLWILLLFPRDVSFDLSCQCSGCMFSLGLSSSDSTDGTNDGFSINYNV